MNADQIEQIEMDRAELGNTDSSSATNTKQETQCSFWCFTYNNYPKEQIEQIERILQSECEWYVFQEEVGEKGTPHLQGTLKLKQRMRRTQLRKLISHTVHWEQTKSVKASLCYCSKYATRAGKIYSYGIDIEPQPEVEQPYGWQLEVIDIISQPPDKRTIHWFWEPNGNVGKSELCKYLVVKHDALMLSGKAADMYHMLSKFPNKRKIIIVDAPRSQQDFINYGAIEQIKNGLVFSGKYEGCQLVFNRPHVIVFANQPPDTHMMSSDRWHVVEINAGVERSATADLL